MYGSVDRNSITSVPVVGHPKEVTKKRGRSAEDFVDVVAEEEDTYTHRAAKRANRKR